MGAGGFPGPPSAPVLGLTWQHRVGGGSPSAGVLYDLRRQVQGLVASRILAATAVLDLPLPSSYQSKSLHLLAGYYVFHIIDLFYYDLFWLDLFSIQRTVPRRNQGTLNKGFKLQQKH